MFKMLKDLFSTGPKVDVQQLLEDGAVLIDVRSTSEYKSGHPKKAVNIPLDQLNSNLKKIKGYNKPVVTCCASGMRSGMAAKQLKSQGIEAYNGGSWFNFN
ncbi:MAG: rhodanese-like domain-containing protein [Bacteroidetes bacterium]|nr:MAG: rhodanese-like domain-containing protein [Bacteroidota bacterium]